MINTHQLLFQHLAAGLNVVEGQVGVKELSRLHLLVDTHHFWWEVNIPGYHRAIPSALYTTLLYGEVAGL